MGKEQNCKENPFAFWKIFLHFNLIAILKTYVYIDISYKKKVFTTIHSSIVCHENTWLNTFCFTISRLWVSLLTYTTIIVVYDLKQ